MKTTRIDSIPMVEKEEKTMKGYFIRKPENGEQVKQIITEGKRQREKAVEIEEVGRVILTLDEYIHFCSHLWYDYDFLKPYADESTFTRDGAKCVLVGAPGQPWMAVCLEGYDYPRYCSWPFADKYQLSALLSE